MIQAAIPSDVGACLAILHDGDYQVVELESYFAELEAKSGRQLGNVRSFIRRLLFVNRGGRHLDLRRAALSFLSTSVVNAWQPAIRESAERAVARLGGSAEADLVEAFARPVAGEAISRLLGLPPEHREDYDRWTDSILGIVEPLLPMRRLSAIERALEGFAEIVRAAMARPAPNEPGGRSTFLHYPVPGLDDEDRVWLAIGLYGASNVTRHTLANNLLRLARVAPEKRAVLTDPDARMAAVERLIAAGTSFETVARYRAGGAGGEERIDVPIAAASLSALKGECPVAHAGQPAFRHVAFGAGIHKCVGAHLARLTIAEALTALIARYPAFSLAGEPSGFVRSVMVTSPLDLPCNLA